MIDPMHNIHKLNSNSQKGWLKTMYSCGQPKSPNSVSQQGVNLGVRFFQILTQIVEMCRKTPLQIFSP